MIQQLLNKRIDFMDKINEPWFSWAQELQFLAQAGLAYTENVFDRERFERIREISAEILSHQGDIPKEKVTALFCNEIGFQTPKLDTRAAIFKDNKILLVQETNGKWSLPGGWVDVTESVGSNTVKEVREEAGIEAKAVRLIALQDRKKHNLPQYIHNITKAFVLCEAISGTFSENTETIASGYFDLEHLPPLATEKNTIEQIEMCFEAKEDENWQVIFD